VATGASDNLIKIWDIIKKEMVRKLKGHKNTIKNIKRIDEKKIASCSADSIIYIWDWANETRLRAL